MRGQYRLGKAGYMRQYRARHRALGLCILCTDVADNGTTRCRKHRLYNSAWNQAKRDRQKAAV